MRKLFFLTGLGALALVATGQPGNDPLALPNSGLPTGAEHSKISSLDQSPTSGAYGLTISSPSANLSYREQLNPASPNKDLFLRLPSTAIANQDAEGIVSIRQLQHKIPKSAQRAQERARDAMRQGRTQAALNELLKAVSIDPGFADAYEELGALYASIGNLKEAAEEFRRALEFDPNHRHALSNLCIILGKLGELEEARRVGQRALQFDPGNAGVHYVLAISLINTPDGSVQALGYLQRAASGVPQAHLVAAQLLLSSGRRAEARQHLNEYLAVASGDEVHKPSLESLLRQLQE